MYGASWKVVSASSVGFSHQAEGRPCEDYYFVRTTDEGWLVAALSDGAGSASRSIEGARAICGGVVSEILNSLTLAAEVNMPQIEIAARSCVEKSIENVRVGLAAANNGSLADFHATLIGVIVGQSGGVFFHIGDGGACAMVLGNVENNIISAPENGEYANETYFFTEDFWKDHLRFTSFGPEFNVVSLMTDGATPFALGPKGESPHAPFFDPVSRFLEANGRDEGERALAATLGSEAARKITNDDKTIVWAVKVQAGGG